MDKKSMVQYLADRAGEFYQVSDALWDNPEVRFTEEKSSRLLADFLEKEGFTTTWGLANLATAFRSIYGTGKPVIGILGEYDALPGMSQVAGTTEKKPVKEGGNGHGCGHNLLGTGSLIAAVGIKHYLEENKLPGTVVFLGCPAEEGGGGKTFMAREHCFDDLDFALTWHPGAANGVPAGSFLANCMVRYSYTGVSSHAAASPEMGRSALDALELLNTGIQYLREHIPSTARIHYAITDTGGISPNIVQSHAAGLYQVRAPFTPTVIEIYERLNRIAEGAAMMTDTKVKIEFLKATSNTVPNVPLDRVLYQNMVEIPCPGNDSADQQLAEEIVKTQLPEAKRPAKPLMDTVQEYHPSDVSIPASTDVGDVSWVCPVAQIGTATWPAGTAAHSWQAVSCGKSDFAHKAELYAGQVIAAAAVDIYNSPETLEAAWAELRRRTNNEPYKCPIPQEIDPNYVKEQMA